MGRTTVGRRGITRGALAGCKAVNLARRWLVIGLCCGAWAVMGCERTEERAAALSHTPEGAPQHAGLIQIPLDSPQLQQLRVQTADLVHVPTDEVIAPAKVVLNPNRIGRVALPVSGRITRVLVGLGDAVTQGQPLLTVDSPDGDAAIAAALRRRPPSARRRPRWRRRKRISTGPSNSSRPKRPQKKTSWGRTMIIPRHTRRSSRPRQRASRPRAS